MKKLLCVLLSALLAAPLFMLTAAAGALGDYNGDGGVTSDDAIYLLRYTLFPEKNPTEKFADFNHDGGVTSDDAIYLLRYTLFPNKFPLENSQKNIDLAEYLSFSDRENGAMQVKASNKNILPSRVVIPPTYDSKDVDCIYSRAFAGSDVETVVIPSTVTEIGGYAFDGCAMLNNVSLPMNLTSVGWGVFRDCTSLATVHIPASLEKVNESMFWGCTSLSNVGFSYGAKEIGKLAFSGCSSLAEIVLPSSVTIIGMAAFQSCSSLASVSIPASVTSIGPSAFNNCKKLTSIDFSGTKAQWNAITKGSSWDNNTGSYTIHCTDGDIKK